MADRAYTLFWNVFEKPPGGVRVTATVPDGWSESLDGMGAPTFTIPHLGGIAPSIVAIHAPGADDAARLEWAMQKQYGEHLAAVTREPQGDGRVWTVHRKGPGTVHARMFLPAPQETVVMAVAIILGGQAGWLDEIRAVFDTVRVVPG